MKIRLRKKKQETQLNNLLTLPDINGAPMIDFENELTNNMRYILTNLNRQGELPPRLAIVSSLREEGVTYSARALGAILGYDFQAHVCVVDLNWWWPARDRVLAINDEGLAAILAGTATIDIAIVPTGWSHVKILPAGKIEEKDRPIVARSRQLRDIIEQLSEQFDHLVLDVPAILATSDSIPLASLADCCILVIRQGVTTVEDVRLALDRIDHLNILGVILNKSRSKTPAFIQKLVI